MQQCLSRRPNQDFPLCFDYQTTTPCASEVLEAMTPFWQEFWGNPSTRHNTIGLTAAAAVSLAREQLANFLQVESDNLIFTSGATEANNLALLGYSRAKALEFGRPGHLITLSTEHHAVLDPLRQLEREGFRLTQIEPDPDGLLAIDKLVEIFEEDTFLVSVMLANNEIGVVQPLAEIAEICRSKGVILHSDVVQGFGNLPLNCKEIGIDLMSISGHKMYGPKGVGALVFKNPLPMLPLQWGGGQEKGLRPGTIPVPLIVGFAKAAELALKDLGDRQERLANLRNKLYRQLQENIPDLIINGSMDKRLGHNLNITVPGVRGNHLHRKIRPLISCSSGSACSNGKPSHVLRAIGRSVNEAAASLRLSLGRNTTFDEIEKAAWAITKVVTELKQN